MRKVILTICNLTAFRQTDNKKMIYFSFMANLFRNIVFERRVFQFFA